MVKVKHKIILAAKKGLGNLAHYVLKQSNVKAYWRMLGGHSAICITRQIKTTPTPKQAFQRWLYSIAEDLWYNMTDGQFILWKRFYWVCRARGWTVKSSTGRKKPDEIKETKKHMGYRAYWVKRILTWKLADWLYSWLKARWSIPVVSETEQEIILHAKIIHAEDEFPMREPREYKVERIRF